MYTAERHFVTTAKAQLRLLGRIDDTVNLMADSEIKASIHKIKLAANPVKARAVYRAALLCEDVLNRSTITSTKFKTSLLSLTSLVGLYTDGLLEIDPDFKSALLDGTITGTSTTSVGTPEMSGENQDTLIAANENSAKILVPLLSLVRDSNTVDALGFLAKYGQNLSKNQTLSRNTVLPSVQFEAIMRQITNRTLSTARAQTKDVSISYAADFDTVEQKTANILQALLENTCLDIVKHGLPKGNGKEKRTWQISLTGTKKNQTLAISITWPGSPLAVNGAQFLQAFQAFGGQIEIKTKKHADRDNLLGRNTGFDIQTIDITCPTTSITSRKMAQGLPAPQRVTQVGEA